MFFFYILFTIIPYLLFHKFLVFIIDLENKVKNKDVVSKLFSGTVYSDVFKTVTIRIYFVYINKKMDG